MSPREIVGNHQGGITTLLGKLRSPSFGAQRIERRPRNSWWRVVRDRRHGAHLHHRQQPLPDATSAEAVEVKAERSVTRSYPTGRGGWEMSGENHHRTIGEGF